MYDLIRRSAVIDLLKQTGIIQDNDLGHLVIDEINRIPTAYDPDAVVEQMEEKTEFLKDCTKYGNESAEQQEKSYSTMMMYEVSGLVEDLIDIVRNAGKDGA